MSIFKCEFCQDINNIQPNDIFYEEINDEFLFFHRNCFIKDYKTDKFNFKNIIEGKIVERVKNDLYKSNKELILNSTNSIPKNIIEEFFLNCEEKFYKITNDSRKKKDKSNIISSFFSSISTFIVNKVSYFNFDSKVFEEEIESFKILVNENEELKEEIINNEFMVYKNSSKSVKKNSILEKWKINIKEKINSDFNNKREKIIKWVVLSSYENKIIKFIEQEKKSQYDLIYLYEIIQIKNSNDLSILIKDDKFNENNDNNKYEIFDYYQLKNNNELIIYKNKETEKFKIYFRNKKEDDCELYDYDSISDTLILYRKENSEKKIGLYFSDNKRKTLNSQFLAESEDIQVKKILLIPCLKKYDKQTALFFIEFKKEKKIIIQAIKVKDKTPNPEPKEVLELSKYYNDYNFDDFQFIVYDFLLILKYNKEKNHWKGKVFSLNLEDNSLFNLIKEIYINDDNDKLSKFSFSLIHNQIYLLSLNIKENTPIIKYWKINSHFSNISMEYSDTEYIDKNKIINIPLGNCIVNYFFHCFEKYHLISSIQYNIQINSNSPNSTKFNIYLGVNKKNSNFQTYVKHLREILKSNKNKDFDNINFKYLDNHHNLLEERDSSLGEILIKALESTPIQIAKIIENNLEIMSNWEFLLNKKDKKKENKKDLSINENQYQEMIKFGMKDSILNFFAFPVIAICCFGVQSIGKSTFLNELTGSVFNVSGMRCTEGIWMSVKVFSEFNKKNKHTVNDICENKCKNCNIEYCCLNSSHINECLCKKCMCGENCELYISCKNKCVLEKGHETLIKCSYENCECKCICDCQCNDNRGDKLKHDHLCVKCFKQNKNLCECECNCRHLCLIPVLEHNFICVSLDFEGLGTFERKSEQDIQMALVGSGLGNNIIFRMGPSFDIITKNFLEKLSEGSRKIMNFNAANFFGGAICFSPKDVIEVNLTQMKTEFNEKWNEVLKNWKRNLDDDFKNDSNKQNNEKLKDRKTDFFGMFKQYILSPTPIITNKEFYITLREDINKEIVEKTLTFHRHPIYNSGKEFYNNLKTLLRIIYFGKYDILDTYKEKNVENYIENNKKQAFAICGILIENENNQELNPAIIEENNGLNYINKSFMKNLEIELVNNNILEVDNNLIINNIKSSSILPGNYCINGYNFEININKNNELGNNSINIKNLNDYGLILNIPNKLTKKITKDNICDNLYKIWNIISKEIGMNEKDM